VIFHEIYKCNQQNKIRMINEDKNNENKENLDNVWYLSNYQFVVKQFKFKIRI